MNQLIRKYPIQGYLDTYKVCIFTRLTTIEGEQTNYYLHIDHPLEVSEVVTLIKKYEAGQKKYGQG